MAKQTKKTIGSRNLQVAEAKFTTAEQILAGLARLKEKETIAENKREYQLLSLSSVPFSPEEQTDEAREYRLNKSDEDFWFWKKTYFPAVDFEDYAPDGIAQKGMLALTELHDKIAHIVGGSRDIAKTANFKMDFAFKMLHGKRRFMGMGGETLTPVSNSMVDIITFLESNQRICFDYKIHWGQASEDTIFIKTNMNPKGTYVSALSEMRSARGQQRGFFQRLDYIYITDFENLTSSLTPEAIANRIARLNEMRTSLSQTGTLIWEGNNFDERCAMNHLVQEAENGILSENFKIHLFPAWNDGTDELLDESIKEQLGSIWPERYPATTEEELIAMMKPADTIDWSGGFQQRPKTKSGKIFPDTYYAEWNYANLPNDILSIIYADPNCSLKEKGDTSVFGDFGFSPTTQCYYITQARCKSYSDPNALLEDLLTLRANVITSGITVVVMGFDGNVAQEATWSNNVKNFSRLRGLPVPHIIYVRYKVDDLIKSPELDYKSGKFLFPPGFAKSPEGKKFLKQFFNFEGKKANKKDDAPDFIICSYELLHKLKLTRSSNTQKGIKNLSKQRKAF